MKAKIVAILLSDVRIRTKWSALFKRDGVRLFWFDEQLDLEDFLDTHYPDLLVLNLKDMDRLSDMKYMASIQCYAVSDNPEHIDICEGYGFTWLPEIAPKDVKNMLPL